MSRPPPRRWSDDDASRGSADRGGPLFRAWFRAGGVAGSCGGLAARLRRPSLARMLPTWCSTVLRLMNRRSEISGLDRPWPSRSSTSASRLVSNPPPLPGRRRPHAERPQHRRGRVRVAGRLQPLERLQRGPRLGHGHLGTVGEQAPWRARAGSAPAPSASGPGRSRRALRAGRPAGRRRPSPDRPARGPVRPRRADSGGRVASAHGHEPVGRGLGLIEQVRGEVHVDEQGQQRRGCRAQRVDLVQGALEDVAGESDVSPWQGGCAASGRAASTSASSPSSSCSASSKRPWRTRRSASRTSAPPRSER